MTTNLPATQKMHNWLIHLLPKLNGPVSERFGYSALIGVMSFPETAGKQPALKDSPYLAFSPHVLQSFVNWKSGLAMVDQQEIFQAWKRFSLCWEGVGDDVMPSSLFYEATGNTQVKA